MVLTRMEEALGGGILRLATLAQRRAVKAKRKLHRDRKGRVTPYLECGTAKDGTLVWLHGFSDQPDSFLRVATALVPRYRVIAPALPGFGEGWVDARERHTFESYASWMGEVTRALAHDRFHLMGNSLGGATALAIAAESSAGIESLVPVNSAGVEMPGVPSVAHEMRDGKNLFAVRDHAGYEQLLARIFARPPKVPRPVRRHLAAKLRRSADWYVRVADDLGQSRVQEHGDGSSAHVDLRRISAPTLVVWGDRDSLFPLAHGEHVARTIPAARLEILEGVGHCPHLERPAKLADAFLRFAARS
jgi:pimeloyl-ACP methyl ester carboxylesterase